MDGEGLRVASPGASLHARTNHSDGFASRNPTTQRDAAMRDNDDALNSLKMFMPRQPPSSRGHEQQYETSGATPMERYLMPGDSSDPSYIRRPAMMQAQCYGDMGSVESRAHQAQVLADKTVREGQTRKGSTRDGFFYK